MPGCPGLHLSGDASSDVLAAEGDSYALLVLNAEGLKLAALGPGELDQLVSTELIEGLPSVQSHTSISYQTRPNRARPPGARRRWPRRAAARRRRRTRSGPASRPAPRRGGWPGPGSVPAAAGWPTRPARPCSAPPA